MKSLFLALLTCFAGLFLHVEKTLAACYVDVALDCPAVATGLAWTPRSVNERQKLFNSSSVQTEYKYCSMFAKLIRTECSLSNPVTTVFTSAVVGQEKKLNSSTFFVNESDRNLSLASGQSDSFKQYFKPNQGANLLSSDQTNLIKGFVNPSTSSPTTLVLNKACDLKTRSSLSEMYSNFVSSNGCFFSYDCQSAVRGGAGDRIVITKVAVNQSYRYFCSPSDAETLIDAIVAKLTGARNNSSSISTMIGDFTVFDQMPTIRYDDPKLISYLKNSYTFTETTAPNLSLPVVTAMMGLGLKSITPFKTTGSIFDNANPANGYGEQIKPLCGTSSNQSFECFRSSGGRHILIDSKKQLNILKQWPRLNNQLPPDAKYFGYINQSSGDPQGRIAKSKILEPTFGKEIYTYLSKNIKTLLQLRNSMVLILTDSRLDSTIAGEEAADEAALVPVVVKGISGDRIIVVNSLGQASYLSFKVDSFRFLSEGSQEWIPVGLLQAGPWPIGSIQSYREESSYTQGLSAAGYDTSSGSSSNDLVRCHAGTVGTLTIAGVSYKYRNPVNVPGNFSNVTVPCRGFYNETQSLIDFTGKMNLSCTNGSLVVNSNNCSERVFAYGSSGKACEVKNGYGTLINKLAADDSFEAGGKKCQIIGCLHGAEMMQGQCVFPELMIASSYQTAFGRLPNDDEKAFWLERLRSGVTIDSMARSHNSWLINSKQEREATINRASIRVFGTPAGADRISLQQGWFADPTQNVKSFTDLVYKNIHELSDNNQAKTSVIQRAYYETTGVAVTSAQMAALKAGEWKNSYENIVLTLWNELKTDPARRANIGKKVYWSLFQRQPTVEEAKQVEWFIMNKAYTFLQIRNRVWLNALVARLYGSKAASENLQDLFADPNFSAQAISHRIVIRPDFSALLSSKNSEQTVKFLFQSFLMRAPESTELANYKSLLDSAKMNKSQLAHYLIESDVYQDMLKLLELKWHFRHSYGAATELFSNANVGKVPAVCDASNDTSCWYVRETKRGISPRPEGFLAYGPNTPDLPYHKSLRATFQLKSINQYASPGDSALRLEIFAPNGQVVIATREVKLKELGTDFKKFSLDFVLEPFVNPGDEIETRVYSYGRADLVLYNVSIQESDKVFRQCEFDSSKINHGGKVIAYKSAVELYCEGSKEVRVCYDGQLTGSFSSSTCRNAKNCTYDGKTILHMGWAEAFKRSRRTFLFSCEKYRQVRQCLDGVINFDSDYGFTSCNNGSPRDCQWGGQTLHDGDQAAGWYNNKGGYSGACNAAKKMKTCVDGTMTEPGYFYDSCSDMK